ncbi:MAG: alpha/beta hydrolase [Tenericutes bacterium GWC2_34_14]|nr:MAG: alpha/beta hydrolase [Tenericutes bacterium GWA2_35_7]OHE29509.1 MAG: alpha/beta hydrolase [Tenericutes bacterium GWC2_34_14]OHE34605.1 MAG: alpha/beta hydrolase [Tenericutes bacterium GWE2_34_108]OHE35962.1 MAG: alpha/beta hydrolase [Tenericutes bacterium GWF1_35_14]OHE38952.1 MAG: alpha/beta hydrolase [Tenericutes bacterium GWF2_35_184]OHE42195.1 MAG: alpha/beta hydrolase [Tenericutes bacterium RIFOXYA12_FULL_35_10]OHE42981.1 MAG: alpha/beta hydrolase [Tenericutes bacterium RIFOXYA2
MAYLDFKGRNIYYDVQGEGKPILILNGIMMSTKSWEPFVKTLSKDNQLIRLDFIDQGQSDKLENSFYTQSIQVDIIEVLLKELNLSKVNLVGISYGGEVAILFATKHPHMVDRLVLFNTTPYTSPWLQEIGHQWNAIGRTRDGKTYYQATIPVIYSPSYFESSLDWMKKREQILIPIFSNPVFLDAMERLTNSAESFDARKDLDKITSPTLIVAADEDYLTPIANQRQLHQMIKGSEMVILPGVGHASMYERPLLFVTLVLGFINALEATYQI